jgi:flagellar motility protein MotE (MotC chaperone)
MMRTVRVVALVALALKAIALGTIAWAGTSARPVEPRAPGAPSTEAAEAGVASELFEKSRGFRDLLEAVHRRGAELDARERAVAAREAALKALEATVTAEVARLEKLGPGVAGVAAPGPAPGGAGAGRCDVALTKIYASMRPEEAAQILDRLDDATAASVFVCMKEKQIGAIMAAMKPDRAVALTHALAGGAETPAAQH